MASGFTRRAGRYSDPENHRYSSSVVGAVHRNTSPQFPPVSPISCVCIVHTTLPSARLSWKSSGGCGLAKQQHTHCTGNRDGTNAAGATDSISAEAPHT